MKIKIEMSRTELEKRLGLQQAKPGSKCEFDWHIENDKRGDLHLHGVTIHIEHDEEQVPDQEAIGKVAMANAIKRQFGLM